MRIALVQQHATDDKTANVERGIEAVRAAARQGAQLACFAELAFEPFYPQRPATPDVLARAEEVPGVTTEKFCRLAAELRVVIILNLFEREGAHTYDCSPVIDADGTLLSKVRMLHITDYPCFHERGYYTPGDMGAPVLKTAVGKVGVVICYDRHYPEVMRVLGLSGAELVVIPQAGAVDEWPEGLFEAEVRTAAFQNGYHAALTNRVGEEECLTFAGESFVCGPDGKVLARAPQGEDHLLVADVPLESAETSVARRLFFKDRRPELYGPWFDGDRRPFRHFLAALAYRFQKTVRNAPPDFGDLVSPAGVRTPAEIVRHMSHVIGSACRMFAAAPTLDLPILSWPEEIARFHERLEHLDRHVASGSSPRGSSWEALLQGPLADAMTHVGQLAMLRRLAGSAIPPENFRQARVEIGRLGTDQDLNEK